VVLESEDGSQSKWARQAIASAVNEEEDHAPSEEEHSSEDGVPGVTVADETSGDEDARRDRDCPPGPPPRRDRPRSRPRAPTFRRPEELRIMPARRIALAALAVLILLLGGGIGAGVWKGGWQPAPKLALDLEGGTQIILQ